MKKKLLSLRNLCTFFFFIAPFLVSLSLLSPREIWAQACDFGSEPPLCTAGDDAFCDDDNPCNGAEFCDVISSNDVPLAECACGTPPPAGTDCPNDADFCNGDEVCDGVDSCDSPGVDPCTAGAECANICDENNDTCNTPANTTCTDTDGDVCTQAACNGQGLCVQGQIFTDLPCDDGLVCTDPDVCAGGECNGTDLPCDDGIECTENNCVEPTGCENPPDSCECQTDADCNDNNVCTDEICDQATFTCVRTNNTDPCNDNLFCNGPDQCAGGTCSGHSGDPCTGGAECNQTCNETADNCFTPNGTTCESDGDNGTVDECNGQGQCVTVGNVIMEGSGLLSCSLHPGENVRFEASLAWAIFGGLGLALAGLLRTLSLRRSARRR